jgi:energy-coupling factor transporter ATP-binding protein EcfA2/CRP-like cAMP-binding protein
VGFVRKDLNLAEATAVVLYVREVSASLQELPGMVVDMQEAAPYMRRLRRVLAAPLRRTPPAQALPAPVGVHEVRLDNVTFRYPDESPGCTDVSLRANRGRWTMLVGLETSGVHTVAELVAGIEEPDSGSITVGGTDLGALDERSLSGLIAVLPAQPSILEATVAENIGWDNPDADRTSIARAASLTGLGAWLASSPDGLETVIGRSRQHLPMEVRVRIAAARVIASAAPVVVIDDPTTALDREVAEELWAALRAQLDGRVVIGVTTRLDLLGDDDLVLAFHAGQVVEQGNRQDLLHSGGRFGRLWSRFVEGAEGIVELGNVPALAALDPEVLRSLTSRLVTERFEPGETIFVEGEPADRVFLIVDGVVDLFADERRLSSVRAGNYFGDLDLANETARTTSARARTPLVTKSLHRLAVSRGVAGVLHRPEEERVVYTWIARHGAATRAELDVLSSRIDVERALSGLLADGTLTTSMDASGATTYRISRSRRQSTHGAGTSLLSTLFPD